MNTTFNPIVPLFKRSYENPALDNILLRSATTLGERFLAYGSNRAAVAVALNTIRNASPGGRFHGKPGAAEMAESAKVWLLSHGLNEQGKAN